MGAVGGAAALALAGVLAFAAVVAGLAAAFALALILARAGMLVGLLVGHHAGLGSALAGSRGGGGSREGASEEARESGASEHRLGGTFHLIGLWFGCVGEPPLEASLLVLGPRISRCTQGFLTGASVFLMTFFGAGGCGGAYSVPWTLLSA